MTNHIKKSIFVIFAMFSMVFSNMAVADDALYEAPIPANKVFVRFLEANGITGTQVSVDTKVISVEKGVLSPYRLFDSGDLNVSYADQEQNISFEAQRYYTLVLASTAAEAKKITIVRDEEIKKRGFSAINLYNYSTKSVTLMARLGDKKRPIFEDVVVGEYMYRQIGARDIGLDVVIDGSVVATIAELGLVADIPGNLVLSDINGQLAANWSLTEVERSE